MTPIAHRTEPRPLGDLAGQIWISDDFDDFTDQDQIDWYGE